MKRVSIDDQVPAGVKSIVDGYLYRKHWIYTDEDGHELICVVRYEKEDGSDKSFRPYTKNDKGTYAIGISANSRPLFNLQRINTVPRKNTIYVVEGEKCADAINNLGALATTCIGSIGGVSKTDWSPILDFEEIRIWPDNDGPGEDFADNVAKALYDAGYSGPLQKVNLPGLPPKGDVVDLVQTKVPDWDGFASVPREPGDELWEEIEEEVTAALTKFSASVNPPKRTPQEQWPTPTPIVREDDEAACRPYPIDAIPESMRHAVMEVARYDQVDVKGPATLALSLTAIAIGKKVQIAEKDGLIHFPSLFFCIVAPSGERKSGFFKQLMAPINALVRERVQNYKVELEEAVRFNSLIGEQMTALKKKMKNKDPDVAMICAQTEELAKQLKPLPLHPQPFATNITEERLFQKMEEREGAFAVLTSEGRDSIDQIMGRYVGGGGTADALYLAGITGDTITRDRVGSAERPEERVIYEPCLNVCIGVQTDKYAQFVNHPRLRDSGLVARIFAVRPEPMAGKRIESSVTPKLEFTHIERFAAQIITLIDTGADTEFLPTVRLSGPAAESRRQFHNDIESELRKGGKYEHEKDIASKTVTFTCKIALLLHVYEHGIPGDGEGSLLTSEQWQGAEALGRFYLNESIAAYRASTDNVLLESALRALEYICEKRLREVKPSILQQNMGRPRPENANQAQQLLDLLEDYGWVRARPKIGKRRPTYDVNPRAAELFKKMHHHEELEI